MNEINRILIFLLLIGLLYALYKYQNIVFESNPITNFPNLWKNDNNIHNDKPKNPNKITIDNISQISLSSLENYDGLVYKPDSLLELSSHDSLNFSDCNTINSSFLN